MRSRIKWWVAGLFLALAVLPSACSDNPGSNENSCVDQDGDGYGRGPDCAGEDCDDDDASVFPGATELCDGLDNDCDGKTDTGCTGPCQSGDGCDDGLYCNGADTCDDDGECALHAGYPCGQANCLETFDRCVGGPCGDFTFGVREWFLERPEASGNVYTIHTLLDVFGPEECYNFEGFDDCTRVNLIWDEGVSFDKNAAFELRGCNGFYCHVGDIFQSNFMAPGSEYNQELQNLFDQYGPPDRACGYVCNADLITKEFCAPFHFPPCQNADECPPGQSCCAGKCSDLEFDDNNCGACGIECVGGECCKDGRCAAFDCWEDTDCDDHNACTVDRCDFSGNTPFVCIISLVQEGTPCDDGLFCNGAEVCDGSGKCENNAENPCGDLDCDEANDTCVGWSCGEFALDVLDWCYDRYDASRNVYHINTQMRVEGSEGCFMFEGYHDHIWLDLSWDEGVSQRLYRTSDDLAWGSGFGPIECNADYCVIGDSFETGNVYPEFPDNEQLQNLVDQYGLPDMACGHVSNADLISDEFCASLPSCP